jgi:hypothetical protein
MPEGPFHPPHQPSYSELKAENERLRAALEWIIKNADPQKAPLIVGRAKAALRP